MNAGELFVNLGVKGADTTIASISGVVKGLGTAKSMSIEAKAGIVGMMYALEHLTSVSAERGMTMQQFALSTGLATDKLQNFQNAALQMGVKSADAMGAIKNIQQAMTEMQFGEGPLAGASKWLAGIGGLDPEKLKDAKNAPFYLLERFRDLTRAMPANISRLLLAPVANDNLQAFFRSKYSNDMFMNNFGPVNSDKTIAALASAERAWLNLGNKIGHLFDQFTAKHGTELVNDFSHLADSVLKLVNALTTLGEKIKIFSGVDLALDTVSNGLSGNFKAIPEEARKNAFWNWFTSPLGGGATNIAPSVPGIPNPAASNPSITTHNHFNHNAMDHHETAKHVKGAINHAYRQYQAQVSGG